MVSNCPAISGSSSDTPFNVTEIFRQRWEDSPEDNRKRLELCWGYNDCGDCHRSKGHCGWCAIVSLSSLNSPLNHVRSLQTIVLFHRVPHLQRVLIMCTSIIVVLLLMCISQAHVCRFPWILCLALSLSSPRSGTNLYAPLAPSGSKYALAVSGAKFRPSPF
jgi:hypothetical protein